MTKQIDLVKKLRDLGDHASFEPSAYHESADAIELLVKALEALACYHHCWCPFREEGKQCPGHEALVVLDKVRAMK